MIVTCDHCGARYKLDDSKISGRGAKITCPRCRHVFVVYKDQGAPEGLAAPPAAASATVAPPTPAAAPAPPAALDVHALDFRKVGIQSWKVKVKIGLVYDFSDYKTLSKYISDGRVTSSDLLSHNGTDWSAIGEIPNLKQHFVDVYVQAEADLKAEADQAAETVTDFDDDDGPTNIIGMDDLAGTLGAERASTAGGFTAPAQIGDSQNEQIEELFKTGAAAEDAAPRFVDPFEQRKKSRERKSRSPARPDAGAAPRPQARPEAAAKPTESGGGGGTGKVLAVAAVALLLLGGGYWWMSNQDAGTGATANTGVRTTPKPPPPKPPSEPAAGSIVPEDAGDEVPADDNWGLEEEPQLIPVVPAEFRNGKTPTASSGAPPPSPRDAARPTQPNNGGGVEYSTMSAADHAQAGWAAYRRGDYSGAVNAFRQAVSMQPGNAEYNGKLGAAMLRSGDAAGARGHLQQAASSGYAPAHDFLGDLTAEQGDSAGAVGHYQAYLTTGPGDASRVQQKIDRLNGT